jgi:hypothetical protein
VLHVGVKILLPLLMRSSPNSILLIRVNHSAVISAMYDYCGWTPECIKLLLEFFYPRHRLSALLKVEPIIIIIIIIIMFIDFSCCYYYVR